MGRGWLVVLGAGCWVVGDGWWVMGIGDGGWCVGNVVTGDVVRS